MRYLHVPNRRFTGPCVEITPFQTTSMKLPVILAALAGISNAAVAQPALPSSSAAVPGPGASAGAAAAPARTPITAVLPYTSFNVSTLIGALPASNGTGQVTSKDILSFLESQLQATNGNGTQTDSLLTGLKALVNIEDVAALYNGLVAIVGRDGRLVRGL